MTAIQGPESSERIQLWFLFPVIVFKNMHTICKTINLKDIVKWQSFPVYYVKNIQYTVMAEKLSIEYTYLLAMRTIILPIVRKSINIYFIIQK